MSGHRRECPVWQDGPCTCPQRKMILKGYVQSMIEPGASKAHGAWVYGHYSKADFSLAVSDEFKRLVSDADIHIGYYRVLNGEMHITNRRGRGAKPITWTEW